MSILYCWMSIRADMKSFAEQTWKATAHSWNMQVVHALRTLFWSCLPREFVALSPILNIYCRPSELLFIYFFIFTTVLSILLREYSCQKRNPYVTVHPQDESGAASLRYRYRAAIIVLRCEQKAFQVWFSWWCKRSPLSDMWLFTSEIGEAQLRSVTENAWPQRFLCVCVCVCVCVCGGGGGGWEA